MCKNVKKVLFALVLTLALALAFACGKKEANEENCKEFCETCPTCEKCNNASAETCKDFCPSAPECKEASAETCKKFQDFIKPTAFAVDGDVVKVGETKEVYVDEDLWEPEDCDKTLIFVSADPTIATVDADGVVTGVRPGTVTIYVTAALNDELTEEIEFEVKDAETDDQKVVNRELDAILAQLPNFVAEEYTLPQPWNTSVKVTYKVGSEEVTKLEGAATDTKVSLAITLELGDAAAAYSVDVWRVSDKNINTFVVIDSAAALLENYFAQFKGEKVAADLDLLSNVFGCAVKWTSSNANALATDGKYTAQAEDKAVTLDALLTYGTGSRNVSFNVTAKGYTATEKADLIMSHTFAKVEGKEFNTSIVLPEYDDLFGAKLTYKSLDDTVYGDDGKLKVAVTEKKDVKFKVTIDYSIAAKAEDNFKVEKELTIKAIPANTASAALEGALTTEAYSKYQKVVHAPWGETEGNIVFPALEGMKWNVAEVTLDARLQDGYQVFSQNANGLKLEAQYLRYQLVSIEGIYTLGEEKARIVLFFNIGISETPMNIISAIWRSSAQKDQTLSEIQGKYDLAGNVSFFDKKIGYVTETYGSGYFSGWSVTTPQKLVLSKKAGATDPEWKCAVGELALTAADYTGITKLVATVKGTADEQILLKVNDQNAGEKWVTLDGTTQEIEFVLPENFAFDATKFPLVVFCNPGKDGTGNKVEISKLQFQGTDKTIDLLKADWRSLDAGVYNVTNTVWQTFMMEVMTVYIREDAQGKVYIDPANVNGGLAGAGGNWGVWYVNTTNKEINIEVGVYNDTTLAYKEGHATTTAIGSRLNIAMDGYALGFVADSTGKIVHGSNNSKLQNGMSDRRAVLGGKTYKAGDKVSEAMYNAMQLEDKATKFEVVYTAADNLVFEQKDDGTFKKVTADDGTVSYAAIAEGETVEAANRFAPKHLKGAALTAEEYAALDADTKKLVTVEYKAKEAVTYEVPNLFGDSQKGTTVNYLTIPANGYAMSWKYQFYGVGVPATVYPFCQTGDTLDIQHYQVHPLSSMDAEYANNNLDAAVELTKGVDDPSKFDHALFETYISNARKYYEKLSGDTKADALDINLLASGETAAAMLIDGDITALLASEMKDGKVRDGFVVDLATMYSRIYTSDAEGKVVNKLTDEITSKITKKEEFDAKYAEYAAIDLTITYDYNGGFAQGFIKYTQKDILLPMFMKDFYEFLVEQKAWEALNETAPTLEAFCTTEYWATNFNSNVDNPPSKILQKYLFLPKVAADDSVNANYHDVIENATTFFNTEKGHKWIELMDYVEEATEAGNRGDQDAWARAGEEYWPYNYVLAWKDYDPQALTIKYGTTNKAIVATKGTTIGAYRFANFVCGTLASADYKNYIPNNVWSSVFDREVTQKQYSRQTYHCTDLTVTLLDAPYKEGYAFVGWKFADGKDAVVTGSMFKDVTVYAEWAPNKIEEAVEKALEVSLDGSYYGPTTDVRYTKATDKGTVVDQYATTGIGDYAFITGGKFFIIGKYAAIELGADATADVTLDTKEKVQVYGTDGSTQFSAGLVNDATKDAGVRAQNSYGYGALYHNAGQFKVTITEVKNTYGRNLAGENFGYDRFLFHYDTEKQLYVGTKVACADGTSVTLEPGDFLWCPMTAERFCNGLTNCNGTSGVEGVWNGVANPEAKIVKVADYLPAAAETFSEVLFLDGATILKHQVFVGDATVAVVKPADLEKRGFKFEGWALKANATAEDVIEVSATTSDVKYYAVWTEVTSFDEVSVVAGYTGDDPMTFATIKEALSHTNANGKITVNAGTYEDDFTIEAPVTIVGPNATVLEKAFRIDEAVVTGRVTVTADDVTIKGLKFEGGDAANTYAAIALGSIKNFTLENNVLARLYGTTDTGLYGNNRRPMVASLKSTSLENIVINNNVFDFSAHASGYLKMAVAIDKNDGTGVKDFTFTKNEIIGLPTTAYYLYACSGTITFTGNYGEYSHTESGTEKTLVASVKLIVDAATETEDATHFKTLAGALAAAKAYDTISLAAGTYSDNITIDKALTIVGPNAAKLATAEDRAEEAVMTGVITIADNVNDVAIKGLKFTGAGQVRTVAAAEGAAASTINNVGIKVINCVFDKGEDTTAAIKIAKANRYYSKDVLIEGCSFNGASLTDSAAVYLDNNVNILVKDSYFENIKTHAVAVFDTSNGVGAGGSIVFIGNTFKNVTKAAIWMNWAAQLADYKKTAFVNIYKNTLENVGGAAAIDVEGANQNTEYLSFNVHHNTFKEVWKCFWLDKVKGAKFNYNLIYTPAKEGYYFAKGTSGYAVDCTKNLYLTNDGSAVVAKPSTEPAGTPNANGAFNAATMDTAETDNFASLEAYQTALLEVYGE